MFDGEFSWLYEVLWVYLGNEISTQQRDSSINFIFLDGFSETLIF